MAEDGKMHWVLNHLPNILHEQDFKFDDDDLVQKLIVEMVNGGQYVGGRDGIYERCILRITVLEELILITSLRNGKHYAQVFVDILQCHKWLCDHPKILHQDISIVNIMRRKSLHWTGMPPYMAFDLLTEEKDSGPHLYHHDLEAPILCHVDDMLLPLHPEEGPTQQAHSQLEEISANFSWWFDCMMSWNALAETKTSFFINPKPLPVSPCFEGFRPCLDFIRHQFAAGIFECQKEPAAGSWKALEDIFNLDGDAPLVSEPQKPVQPFDDATLGGHIKYGMFLTIMQIFKKTELVVKNTDQAPVAPQTSILILS
ncbi:hypothetical protein IW262DRAFT_1529132 [Armillaria fumosa]|nr:hypothetical protein IW262DRAFT_1529132 [Armillaria fumosa]